MPSETESIYVRCVLCNYSNALNGGTFYLRHSRQPTSATGGQSLGKRQHAGGRYYCGIKVPRGTYRVMGCYSTMSASVVCLGVAWSMGYIHHVLATENSTTTQDYTASSLDNTTEQYNGTWIFMINGTWPFRKRYVFASFSNAVFRNLIFGVIGVVVVIAFSVGRYLYRKRYPPTASIGAVVSPGSMVPANTGEVISPGLATTSASSTMPPTNTYSQFGTSSTQYSTNFSNYSNFTYSNVT